MEHKCQGCGIEYKGDLIIPDELWVKISPHPVEGFKGGGLLCGKCIMEKLEAMETEPFVLSVQPLSVTSNVEVECPECKSDDVFIWPKYKCYRCHQCEHEWSFKAGAGKIPVDDDLLALKETRLMLHRLIKAMEGRELSVRHTEDLKGAKYILSKYYNVLEVLKSSPATLSASTQEISSLRFLLNKLNETPKARLFTVLVNCVDRDNVSNATHLENLWNKLTDTYESGGKEEKEANHYKHLNSD